MPVPDFLRFLRFHCNGREATSPTMVFTERSSNLQGIDLQLGGLADVHGP